MINLANEEYLHHLEIGLRKEKVNPSLCKKIVETVSELLRFYEIEDIEKLLPSLLEK